MMEFAALNNQELKRLRQDLQAQYHEFKSRGLNLDITRGKPCSEQLDLALGMLDCVNRDNYLTEEGTDNRNYGGLDGIPEAKKLFAEYMEVQPEELIIGGNSSLNLMHDTFMRAIVKGVSEDRPPWGAQSKIKFLCPSPGYDRHFFICDYLDIEMITVAMDDNGPDMTVVEELVSEDQSIKGIWCVPKYSNPTGAVYSDEVVERLASMDTKADDFRIFWDNAYTVHHLNSKPARLKNILTACKKAGNPERVFIFGSTSKVAFAGSGLSMMAGSAKNMALVKKQIAFQTIGPDKLNQLRHVTFFKNMAGIEDHMKKLCSEVVEVFDLLIPFQYSEADRRAGYFFGKDRRGQLYRVPLMTLSIGIITNERRRFTHPAQVSTLATEMKSYAKTLPGSVYVVDRRHDDPGEPGQERVER